MPATFQGTRFADGQVADPLRPPAGRRQRRPTAIQGRLHQRTEPGLRSAPQAHDQVDAQIGAYELAYRMQSSAPEVVDLSRETAETQRLYGIDQPETERNGRNCLLARRLVERGVRFVQVYMGAGSRWDAHSDLEGNHAQYCRESDRPIAGLLKDLKRRGLLESTW